jgi:tRNA (5-methylaminomethyl-2-thiouridylate)-methyltransferase
MIYLDHNATTPLAPEVLEAMTAALRDLGGNPSSTHAAGRAAREAVEAARAEVAALIGATPEEIVFTSGGTEANDLAIRGTLRARGQSRQSRWHAVSTPIEHPSVLGSLADSQIDVAWLPVGPQGELDPEALRPLLRPETALVSVALANHELGNVADVAVFAAIARAAGAAMHTDAVQAAGKIPIDVAALGIDALSLSAHKLHGPKGVGALFVRRASRFEPVLRGGHQERERRAGTENVAGIVGFGVAARLARLALADDAARVARLRDRLAERLLAIPGARRNGDPARALPGTLNVELADAPGQLVAAALDLDGICVSTGTACSSASLQPSPVLLALGRSREAAAAALRFGLGRGTTEADVDTAATRTAAAVARVRTRGTFTAPVAGARARVVVAMSGGVDSSTTAALLVEAGHDVVGVTLRLYDASGTAASVGGRCCGPRDIEDARATAARLGIPHHVIDETAAFSAAVIDDFVAEHRAGRTPNPCVRCNEKIKFGPLLAFADAVGATALATGHYARLLPGDDQAGGLRLARARDEAKDQSYFLFGVRPEILARVWFPLGDLTKDDVRALARRHGLPNADKPDSNEICFIPDGDHQAFVAARGGAGPAGEIVDDETGAAIGAHGGTHTFTVGQRKGLPAGAAERRFVLRIDAATGQVRVGPRSRLGQDQLRVADVRWLDRAAARGARRCAIQIRHHATPAPGWVEASEGDFALVRLDAPAYGVAPGQAAVFYDGDDRVLGGGWIDG